MTRRAPRLPLLGAFGAVVVCFIAASAYSGRRLRQIDAAAARIAEAGVAGIQLLATERRTLADLYKQAQQAVDDATEGRPVNRATIATAQRELAQRAADYAALPVSRGQQASLVELERALAGVDESIARVLGRVDARDYPGAHSRVLYDLSPAIERADSAVLQLIALQIGGVHDLAMGIVDIRRRSALFAYVLEGLSVALAIVAAVFAVRVVGRSMRLVEEARERAERASLAKGDFLSLVTHELRTPLTALKLQLDRLARDRQEPLSAKQQVAIARLIASSNRLAQLIESVLEHSRVDSGRLHIRSEPVDLERLAAGIIEEHLPLADAQQIPLGFHAQAHLPELYTDARLVRIVIANLVGNALKFTQHGRVDLALSFEGGVHVIRVADTGPGIPPDQRATIFEPFRHIEPLAGKHTPGVGLGLALVKEILTALGGEVVVDSEEGRGSVFTVRLPGLHVHDTAQPAAAQP